MKPYRSTARTHARRKGLLAIRQNPPVLTEITLLRCSSCALTRMQSTDPSRPQHHQHIVDAMQPLATLAHTQNLITPNSDTLTHTLTDVLAQLDALQHP